MDIDRFCRRSRVLIVAGKGGVGKTTVSAALARMAARAGLSALIVEIEGKGGLSAAFGVDGALDYDETILAAAGQDEGEVRARTLTSDDALVEYLEEHGMKRISKRLVSTGAIEVVATAVPGIKDILVLGKIKQLERAGAADLIIVDAPAAGHAVTFLTSAAGLVDAVRVGPIRSQAQDVLDLLQDSARCQVLLVTLPEETPVNEVVDTAYLLEDKVGISLAGVVVNGIYPSIEALDGDVDPAALASTDSIDPALVRDMTAAAAFRSQRRQLQEEQLGRLASALPLPQMELPFLFTNDVGRTEIDLLAEGLAIAVEGLK